MIDDVLVPGSLHSWGRQISKKSKEIINTASARLNTMKKIK